MKFELGKVVQTQGIYTECEKNITFEKEVLISFNRYINGDWGDLTPNDKQMNEFALDSNDRILAKYKTCVKPIYIITEADRSVTTILFCDEY